MSNLGKAVLAWDEFLQRDDYRERLDQLRQWFRASGRTSLMDQGDAATEQLVEALSETALQVGSEGMPLGYKSYPDWVRLGVLGTIARWGAGEGTTCRHAPSIARPRPVVSAAWKPDLVVCTACLHLLELPHSSAANHTCDGCGYVVPNTEILYSFTISHGWLMWQAGACADCRFWTP
ncbi:hypothetical protein [Nonomuraea wenchangensis]|uniref:hypothetical protein n=1 Tax=Nonomuraea wenchangensis TaxID=568860 RepID=UPI003325BAAC